MKKIPIYIAVIILVIIAGFVFLVNNKKSEPVQTVPDQAQVKTPEPIAMCYEHTQTTSNGLVDRAWVKLLISDSIVTGQYYNLPAEKDSKVGKFAGTVGPMNPAISGRIADVWWNSMAEGMQVTEQLYIEFGEGSAVALFGEMIDRGDGTYVYRDIKKLTPGLQMSQIDCETLQDKLVVEQYIREHSQSLIVKKPVLGGTWYIVSVQVNPFTKTGVMVYEDGHIQDKMTFNYIIIDNKVTINLVTKK